MEPQDLKATRLPWVKEGEGQCWHISRFPVLGSQVDTTDRSTAVGLGLVNCICTGRVMESGHGHGQAEEGDSGLTQTCEHLSAAVQMRRDVGGQSFANERRCESMWGDARRNSCENVRACEGDGEETQMRTCEGMSVHVGGCEEMQL